ncbi:MAG: leucine-rich repeat domain-containing protein [Lachnospiraceae bacterium]|nr:leucine-rich repeat domain-containing protein [Lachnospiraceae bacterium]
MRRSDILFAVLLSIAAITASVCKTHLEPMSHAGSSGYATVFLVPDKGMDILSENPKTVPVGEEVCFDVAFHPDYYYEEKEGVSGNSTTLFFGPASSDKSYYYKPGHLCDIHAFVNGAGKASITTPLPVPTGGSATATFSPDEHRVLSAVSVNGVPYPLPSGDSFTFTVRDDSEVEFSFIGEPVTLAAFTKGPGYIASPPLADHRYGEIAELSVSYDSANAVFEGWTEDLPLSESGTFLTADEELKIPLKGDTVCFANFKSSHTYDVNIDPNGGTFTYVSGNEALRDCSPSTLYNLPADNGSFKREGYVLTGYNTKPDGSGTHHAPGAMISMPENNVDLYCEWAKITPEEYFTYRMGKKGLIITGLTDDAILEDDTLCIPQSIDGVQVLAIGPEAFRLRRDIETVIIPTGIDDLGESCFSGCTGLTTLYLPETLKKYSPSAFNYTYALSHLHIIASLPRVYDYDYDSALADKFMRLKNTEGRRIILVGGSSLTFGINSPMIQTSFPDYQVVNFSCSYRYGIIPLLDLLENNVREGDIVIFAPEYIDTMYANSESGSVANWEYLESNYDILEEMDLKENRSLLGTFVPYLNGKRKIIPGKSINSKAAYSRSGMNYQGDLITVRNPGGPFKASLPSENLITSGGMEHFNSLCYKLNAKGAVCCFSFPPICIDGMSREEADLSTRPFSDRLSSMLDTDCCRIISTPGTYVMSNGYFYDNASHLTIEGAAIRTGRLIEDINASGVIQQ